MRTVPSTNRNRRPQKQKPILPFLLIGLALFVAFRSRSEATATSTTPTESTIVLQTAGAPSLEGTFQTVNNQFGDQVRPHVSCNLATYTFDDYMGHSTVHYQDLITGTDNVIPGNEVDLMSDISGTRVAYTEFDFPGEGIMIFDTASRTRTVVPGLRRSTPSIGGDLVAFEDRSSSLPEQSEISTYDLSTGTVTPLTNDSLRNRWPNVSPNGNAVVWVKCQTNGLDCAIYAALQTAPGVFTTRALTEPAVGVHLPSTNGEIAAYASDRTGESDIYYQALAGGAEVHLAIPGAQRNARVSGDLISFESQQPGGYDIFIYDIRSGRLFQVTNTLALDETMNEISVCNGVGRIVYTIPGNGDFDVHAFTFQVPGVNEDQIDDLITLIRSFNLPPGTANSLITKLQSALAAIDSSDTATACSFLTAFTNECVAQSGKKLTPDQATQLINSANQIKSDLGCQ